MLSRVNVWSDDAHPSVRHKNARVFHHLGVVSDGGEFSWGAADVVLVGHVTQLLHVVGLLAEVGVFTQVAMDVALLFELGQGSCSLVELLLLVG